MIKAVLWVLLALPAAVTAWDFYQGNLGARPITEAIHQVGLWGIRFLFVALAITPLRLLWRWNRLALWRRNIGVASFCYIVVHFTLYIVDQKFDLEKVAGEIVFRIYLTIGFVALLGLLALAVTSTDAMTRKLGGKRWRDLHRVVYAIGILAVIHFFMQSKLNVYEPTIMGGIFLWLMGWRTLQDWTEIEMRSWEAAALLSVAVGILTALGEALYFASFTPVPVGRVLEANFMFDIAMLRPGWIVLLIGLAVSAIAAVRRPTARKRPRAA
jgi:methionine sulfoxide reductase heme-binding subunit